MHSFIIAAVAENGVIGADGDLVWDLPADQAYFKQRIRSAQLLTGRVSFESNQGQEIFPEEEQVIVLTRQKDYRAGNVRVAHSLAEAWQIAEDSSYEELAVLGGANVYKMSLPKVDTLYITEVHAEFEGDTFFPKIPEADWQEVQREDFPADKWNPYPFSFVTYRRKN
ncbi:MAG TPA: dihydrofolate reductase [Saprospiraceae bacterium]|nr:dihydrofolate reductase [Saprospiraceae bacterium]